jgi:hypothetical protein
MKHLIPAVLLLTTCVQPVVAFQYSGRTNTYTCDGTQSDIQAAIDDAAANHPAPSYVTAATVRMTPAGPGVVELGENDTPLTFGTSVILTGNGMGGANGTYVMLPRSWTGSRSTANTRAVIEIGDSGAWIENFDIPDAVSGVPPFSAKDPTGARITSVAYNNNGRTAVAYFCFVGGGGTTPPQITIDNCNITGGAGNNELILMRGASDAWQKPDTFGGASNIFIETNTFNGLGYVCDANANAAVTLRFNTINGPMKIDGHGRATNTPARSVRLMEVYGNVWTLTKSYWQALEIRGGTNRVFENSSTTRDPAAAPWFTFDEYGCLEFGLGTFGNVLLTPKNYPIPDQIGEGEDVDGDQAPGGSDPAYVWNNTLSANGASWPWSDKSVPGNSAGGTSKVDENAYLIGEGVTREIKLSTQAATILKGKYIDKHGTWTNAVAIEGDDNRYVTAETTTASEKKLLIENPGLAKKIESRASPAINFNAYTNWQYQTGTGGPNWKVALGARGSFHITSEVPETPDTVILANRDFFPQTAAQHEGSFDGTQGVNCGTYSEMLGNTPSVAGVGWWVTDQGSWNSTLQPNTSGALYVWNGSRWQLKYIPYQYPYYQRVAANQSTSFSVAGARAQTPSTKPQAPAPKK